MRRIVCFVLALFLVSGFAFADEKKRKRRSTRRTPISNVATLREQRKICWTPSRKIPAPSKPTTRLDGCIRLRAVIRLRPVSSLPPFPGRSATQVERRTSPESHRRPGSGVCAERQSPAAKDIYLAALAEKILNAMYNYNLACVYAELHDLDAALPYLAKSWEHRDTLPSYIKYPDPRADNSFKPYLNDPRFKEAVKHIVL